MKLRVRPNERGHGITFEDVTGGVAVPREFVSVVEEGVQEEAQRGVLAHFPVVDFHVELYDGSFHEVDSSESAFRIATSMALREAMKQASPTILEPMMSLEVIVPSDYMGDVIGDLNSRRGKVRELEQRNRILQGLLAWAPLAEMFGYATELRSMSQGRGTYSMQFSHYEPVPKRVGEELAQRYGAGV